MRKQKTGPRVAYLLNAEARRAAVLEVIAHVQQAQGTDEFFASTVHIESNRIGLIITQAETRVELNMLVDAGALRVLNAMQYTRGTI